MSEFLDLLDSLDGSGQVVSPDQDDSNVFARKFKESFAQTGANLKGGFGALVGDEALMDDALSDQQDASTYYGKEGDVNDVFEVESVGDLGNYVAGVTGSAAGSLVQIGAGGGVFGAAAKGMAKRGAKQALNKRLGAIAKDRAGSGAATSLGKATADMVADVARKEAVEGGAKKVGRAQLVGGSAGMVATSFPQLSGASALEIYRETGDINAGAAFLTGALQTLPDVFPVLREFKKLGLGKVAGEKVANALVKDEIKFKRLMKSVAKTGSIEGGTEILQDVIGNVTLEILNENKDHFSVSDIKGFINSGIGGFAGGVMMGAPSASIEAFKSDDPWFKAYEIEQNTLKEAGLKAVDSGDDVALAQVKRQMEENKAVKDKKISELLNAQGKQVDTADLFADKVRLYRDKPDSFGAYGDSLKPIRDRALSDIQSEANKAKVAGDEALFDALIGEYQALQGDDSVEATTGGDTFSSVTRVLDKDTGEAVPVENKISDARQRQIDIQSNVQTQSVEELLKADSAPDETLIPQDVNEDFPLGVNEPMTGLDYTEQDYLDQVAGVALDDQEKNVSSFDKQGNNDGDYGKTDSVADDVSPSKAKAGVGAEAVDGQAGEVANSGIEDFRSNIPSIGGENTPSTGGGKFNPTHVLEDGTEVVAVDGWDGVYEDSNGESFELESDDVQLLSPSVKGDELSRAAQDKSSFDAYAIPGVGVNSDAWKLFVDYRKKIGEPITEAQQTYKSAGHLNSLSASDQKMLVEQTIKNKNIIVDRYLDKESDNTEKVNKSTKPEIFEPTHVDGKGIEHQFYEGRWWDEWGEVSGSEKKRPKGIRKIKKGQGKIEVENELKRLQGVFKGKIDGVKLVKLFNNKFTESEIQEYIDETREVTTKPLVNGSKKTKVMTYEQYLNESDKLQKLVDSASDKLKKYDTQRDNKGLLPDDVRKGDAYKKDKGRFDDAFERLREYNSTVPKAFMQRASAERRVKKVNSEVSDESTKLDKSSKGTLAGVSAGEVQGTAKSKKTGTGTTGSSRNDVAGNESVDGWRGTGNGSVGDGTGEVSVSSGGKPARGILSKKSDVGGAADGESVKAVGGKSRNGDGRGVPEAVDEVGRGRAGLSEPETHLMDNGVPIRVRRAVAAKHNYSIDPADLNNLGGAKTKYKNNIKAIQVLKSLEGEDRSATAKEQKVLSKYVGWGGIPQAFINQGKVSKGWDKESAELKALLTEAEYKAAIQSTQNAHYTSPEIIDAMYQAVENFGFTGGKVLESSVGTGNFLGLMPDSLRNKTRVTGVELDSLTGRIAKQLYPTAHILPETGFQDFKVSDGTYDLAIGNPPFGSETIYDESKRHLKGFSIHNFFFAKSLDLLKPNGLLAMVVSNSLLDASGTKARAYMATQAEFLGAVRLPNNAFLKNAGTEVTTDIIFMRKLADGEVANNSWVDTGFVADALGGDDIAINQYFVDNPKMMLGRMERSGSMYRGDMSALVGDKDQDTGSLLSEAVGSIEFEGKVSVAGREVATDTYGSAVTEFDHSNNKHIRVGSMFLDKNGDLFVRRRDEENKFKQEKVVLKRKYKGELVPDKTGMERVKGMIGVRDVFSRILKAQLDESTSDDFLDGLRGDLNRGYDEFVKQFGPINHPTNKRLFIDDPSFAQISALEESYDKGLSPAIAKRTGEPSRKPSAVKAAVFSKRTQSPIKPVMRVDTAKEALIVSLSELGVVDIAHMVKLSGKSEEVVLSELKGLIFYDPAAKAYVTRDAYLSGNVKEKLAQALEDGSRPENIKELQAVQPEDISAVYIDIKLGSGWLPPSDMNDFVAYISGDKTAKTGYSKFSAKWEVNAIHADAGTRDEWGTNRLSSVDLIKMLANQKAITVKDTIKRSDGSKYTVINEKATLAAKQKAEKIKTEFGRWVWSDDARRERLARQYNDTFNTNVLRVYDGEHLTFPGKISDDVFKLRPHQANAAWRIIQGGTHLLDHVVGAGKTAAAIAGVMELRRIGLADKPMIVVPNHLVSQWAADILKLYPGASVLAATKKDFQKDNRKRFMARVSTGDWDAVIVAHSSFKFIEVDPEYQIKFIKEQVSEIKESARILKEADGKSLSLKEMAKMQDRLEEKLKALNDSGRKDKSIYWQEMGVDALVVDEAHEFKNLGFTSGMQRVAGLGNQQGSQKAADLFMKSQALLERTGGRNLTFLTGTPISNTMAEMFTLQRYLDNDGLKDKGLIHFDAWSKQFGEVVSDWELSPAGTYKLNSRFAKFVNMPELMQQYLGFSDVITRDDIRRQLKAIGKTLPIPKLKGGKPKNVIVGRSSDQADYIGEPEMIEGNEVYPKGSLVWRSENLPKGKPKKGDDNMLKIMSDARKAALDMRLVDPSYADNPDSKVHESADNIKTLYDKWHKDKGAQLVFIDLSTPKKSKAKEALRLNNLVKLADDGDAKAIAELDKVSPDEFEALQSTFSVYDDLRTKLVERGIPDNEIAYIHDANTDLQKDELFGKVRSGRIRVLLGSSAKMGAGMNAQERLVGLHHLDVPWRPSDLEQREGRIIRQGNVLYERDPDGFEIEIYRYATKNTLDSRMWQTIESKARFIEQVRKGDLKAREVEDIGAESSNAAEMKAASSGNPLVLREMEIRTEIRKLEGLASEHDREQYGIKDKIRRFEASLPVNESLVKRYAAEIEYYNKHKAKGKTAYALQVGSVTYDKRTKAGKALLDKAKLAMEGKDVGVVGKLSGYDIRIESVRSLMGEKLASITLENDLDFQLSIDPKTQDAGGLALKLDNLLKAMPNNERFLADEVVKAREALPKLKKQVRDFERQAELDALIKERVDVIAQLQKKDDGVDDIDGKKDGEQVDVVESVKDDVSFKLDSQLASKKSIPVTKKEFSAVVDSIFPFFKSGTVVNQVLSASELPVAIHESAFKQGFDISTVQGVMHDGAIYVVRENVHSSKQLEEVIYHELYGHYGLRKLYGKKLDRRLINFWNAIGREAGLDKLAKKYGIEKNIATYKKAKGWKIPAQRNAMLMDELLAHVAQKETGSLKQKALEIIGVVRQWLRGHGFKWLGKMNRADIALVLRDARGAVVKGNMADGSDVRFSLAASDDVFSDIDKTLDDKKGVKSVKDALAKSFEYVKDRAHEFSKNGGLSLLTLRQLTDVGEKVLPMAKEYMLRVERMLTERNKMQDESAKLALRWQALNKKVRNRLAHVMHESTLLGVDPSYSEFQTAKVQVIGGMIAVRRAMGEDVKGEYSTKVELVESNEANLKLLAKRKYKAQTALRNARTTDKDAMSAKRDAHKLAIKEWKAMRNAIIKDIRRKKKFDGLRRKFDALDEGAQAIFVEARDMYLARSERTEKALMSKIRSAGMTEAQSKKAMQMIRMEFESARLDGVYFPLFRKGDYFVRAEKLRTDIIEPSVYLKNDGRIEERENKGTGEKAYFIGKRSFKTLDEAYEANKYWGDAESAMGAMHSRPDLIGKSLVAEEVSPGRFVLKDKMTEFEFTMHNTAREAERYMDAMGSEYSGKRFGKLDKVQTKEDFSVSGSFLADVFGVMDDGGVTDDVKDSIYQVYLETLPELSQRKHFIHRKMTVGFSDDALQAFANNMGHQAHQVSKLEASDGLQEALDDVADHAKQVDQADAVLAGNLRDELKLRHEWVMNPDNAGWTNKTSAFGFFMYLGASPASALVNLTQTAVVAYPILASEFGWKSAGKALARAGSELNMRETVLGDGAIDTTGLTHNEGRALQAWYDEGVIDRSQAHMLAGIGDSDSLQNSPGYQKWMGRTAHLFHKAEIVNREVTLLAGYRLAIEAGVPHDAAVAKSSEMTWEAHFDYSNANRARMMQGDFAKLFLMFRSYSQHMIYFMLKNANDWGKGGVEGKKAQARLLGMLGVTFAMGGASALPVGMVGGATALAYVNKKYGTKRAAQLGAMGGLLFMASLLWDDDEPLDWETETKAALREMGGDTLEALVFRGVINAGTGINVSSRISLDDLLVRSPNREMEGRDLASHYLSQAAGPVVGYGTGLFSVPDLIREDHSARALEKVAPKFLRDYVTALRYGGEGVLNMRGDAVVEKDLMGFFSDDISLWNIFWQAQGFSPEDVGRQYGKTNEIKNYEGHIQRKKKRILSQYFIARKENDGKGMAYALERAKAWNKANPKAKQLDQKALNRSFKTRMRYSNQSLNGANVSKQYRYLVDELNAG